MKLDKKEVYELLGNWDIGKIKRIKHIIYAFENAVYIITSSKGKYILKVFGRSDPKFLTYEIGIMNYLARKGMPVQKTIKNKLNKDILINDKRRVVLFEYIEGKEPRKIDTSLIIDITKKFALMQKYLMKLKLNNQYVWEYNHEFKSFNFKEKIKGFNFNKHEKVLLKEIVHINKKKLRRSVIHGDFNGSNFLIKDNKLKAIIDWDDVHEDYLIYDTQVFITHLFMLNKKRMQFDKIRIFFKEYQKYIKLNEEEKKAMYYFVKNRILSVLKWCREQEIAYPDRARILQKWTNQIIIAWKNFDKVSLEDFLKLF